MSENDEYDDILFNGESNGFLEHFYKNFIYSNQIPAKLAEYDKLKIIETDIKNNKYFKIGSITPISYSNGQYQTSSISYIFKNYIVDIHLICYCIFPLQLGQFGDITIDIVKHNIPNNILFAIKHFQYHKNFSCNDIYNIHPEYFTTQIDKNINHEYKIIESVNNKLLIDQKK
jgi:hypothetical protein